MPIEKDFDNKRVVVVGGSSGVGLSMVERYWFNVTVISTQKGR